LWSNSFEGVLNCPEDAELVHITEREDSRQNLTFHANNYLRIQDEYFPRDNYCVDR